MFRYLSQFASSRASAMARTATAPRPVQVRLCSLVSRIYALNSLT